MTDFKLVLPATDNPPIKSRGEVPLDLETRKAITGLRKLFQINPGECHLFTRDVNPTRPGITEPTHERWLSDRYVMLNVTGSPVLRWWSGLPGSAPEADEWADGAYKLTAGKGLVPLVDHLPPDTPGLLNSIETGTKDWYQMHRTDWSMADDEAKKMLCYAVIPPPAPMSGVWHEEPLAINEGIWTEIEKHFETDTAEPVMFEYAPGRPYRVSQGGAVVAYVAAAVFPMQMREQALAVVDAA